MTTATCSANLTIARITIPFFVGPVPMTASIDVKADATASVNGHLAISANQHLDGAITNVERRLHQRSDARPEQLL